MGCQRQFTRTTIEENEKRPSLRTGAPFLSRLQLNAVLGLLLTTILLLYFFLPDVLLTGFWVALFFEVVGFLVAFFID